MAEWEQVADWLASALESVILRSKLGGSEAWALERWASAKDGDSVRPPAWNDIQWDVDPASTSDVESPEGVEEANET